MSGTSIAIRGNSSEATMSSRRNSLSSISMSMGRSESHHSTGSHSATSKSDIQFNARITMFPQFANKLENLKAVAQEMMDNEPDPVQQDVIAQQFAEASLTILRQLRYHCMENGLDGWRQGKLRRKVLIVDDSIVTRKLVARAFERVNFIVDTAENGVEGVNKMKESIYDIAFMDIDMPVMNGFEATKRLREWEDAVRPGTRQPICALTAAHVDDFERSELMKFKEAGLDVSNLTEQALALAPTAGESPADVHRHTPTRPQVELISPHVDEYKATPASRVADGTATFAICPSET